MRIIGILRPPSKAQHERARIWAAAGVAGFGLLALMLLIGSPPPAPLRAARIADFADDPGTCRGALASGGFEVARIPDLREAGGCGYRDAVELTRSVHAHSAPLETSCAAAAALVLWEREVLRPSAQRHYGQEIARIEVSAPAYQCRRIAGRRDGRLSEHARANAVDITGFTLADGRTVSVLGGWRGRDRSFLRDVRDGGCNYFNAVLSPDYNRAHRDHLHFDLGRDDMCR